MAKRITTPAAEVEVQTPAEVEVEAANAQGDETETAGEGDEEDGENGGEGDENGEGSGDDGDDSASDDDQPANPAGSLPGSLPSLTVRQRVTIGGRGAKKDASGAVVTPAEPTVEIFKGSFDLSALAKEADIAAAEEGLVLVPRSVLNIAAGVIIDEVSKALRAERRAAFEAACKATEGDTETKGKAAEAALTPATDAEVSAAIAKVLDGAPDPFAPKPKAKRTAPTTALKEANTVLSGKVERMQAKALEAQAALNSGDTELFAKLNAELMAIAAE